MQLLYSIPAFIVALGILVVVHEFGHYWVARRAGVKVLRFSVGFGKALWSRTVGPDKTEWVVAAIPLGGYVKMLDEAEGEVRPEEVHRAFNRQSLPKRCAIVVAGPAFNLLFAVLAYWLLFSLGVDDLKPEVGAVAKGSYGERIGFQKGDRLQRIDGMPVSGWSQHSWYLLSRALSGDRVVIEIESKVGATKEHDIDFSEIGMRRIGGSVLNSGLGLIPVLPRVLPVIGYIEDGPAKNAGVKIGDRILSVSGKSVDYWSHLVELISSHPGKLRIIELERNGEILKLEVVPKKVKVNGKVIGRINVGPEAPQIPQELLVRLNYSASSALKKGVVDTWTASAVMLKAFYKMLTLEVSTESISGPITIAKYAGYSAKTGPDSFLMFLAIVSISLGVINLLPIPVLDGGHLMYYAIEAIKGSPVSEQVMIWGQQVGILLIVALMSLAIYNDIDRLFR